MKDNISFSPSVNIIRDQDKNLNYVVTKNAIKIANQIISDFNNQLHSFSIIGSYGTGKSSFLWALEKNLKNEGDFFFKLNGQFNNIRDFEIINIVGSYSPIEEIIYKTLNLKKEVSFQSVFNGFRKYYENCKKRNKFLLVIIDEFGKILEYAAQNNPGARIYFLQQLAEFINDPDNNIILINTLHQNFNAYSSGLKDEQKQEWNKVRGRFVELTFNEPVEQILFLASDQIKRWNVFGIEKLFNDHKNDAIINSRLLPTSEDFAVKLSFDLLPLDVLSASVLTSALKDYGQNERSLFTMLAQRNNDSLYQYAQNCEKYDLAKVYDFLIESFYSHITDKYNREKNKWDRIKISLDRVSNHFPENRNIAEKLIKTIGILSIYGNKAGKLNNDFLINYSEERDTQKILNKLLDLKIILFRKHLNSYTLTEGTDLDYYEAIDDASSKIEKQENIVDYLNRYYSLPFLHAKRTSYEKGTPRFFEFFITDELIDERAIGEIDGNIYLIFNSDLTIQDIKDFSKKSSNANIYVQYKNVTKIKSIVFEIQKVEYVIGHLEDDFIAGSELEKIKESLRNDLNNEVLDNLYSDTNNTIWFYNGKKETIDSEKKLNELLTVVSESIFKEAPIIKNELINKHKISTAISTARKNYIRALLSSSHKEDLGFDKAKFPPEKTIYQTLLKNTGIHRKIEESHFGFAKPNDENILSIYNISNDFLNSAIGEEKDLKGLIELLKSPPYKLKDGLIQFWIPTLLIIKRDEYALFHDGNYIPYLTEELFDIFHKNPNNFSLRTYPFGGIELKIFRKYKDLFETVTQNEVITNQTIIETIKPFLLFYRNLPSYTKTTNHLSPKTKDFRDAIANATDPYTAFFEKFPKALGYSNLSFKENEKDLNLYFNSLNKAYKELLNAYQQLIDRFELQIQKIINANDIEGLQLKDMLANRFKEIRIDRVSKTHKKLLSRFKLPYDNKTLWLESVAMAIIEKPLQDISDTEEDILYTSFESLYMDLIDLLPIHQTAELESLPNNKMIGIKIIDSAGNARNFQTIINKENEILAKKIEEDISKYIKNKSANEKRAILIELLNNLSNE